VTQPPPSGFPTPPNPAAPAHASRPAAIVAAVVLMLPVAAVWLVCAVAWGVAMARMDGAAIFAWALGIPISGLCLLVTYMGFVAIRDAWRGTRNVLQVPAGFTFSLFGLVLIRLLVERKLEFEPTMVTPIVLGVMAGVALGLSRTRPAQEWFARPR
jgi:hypothetical protein